MIEIEILGMDGGGKVQLADDGRWTSDIVGLADLCESIVNARPYGHYDPDPLLAKAQYLCQELGGKIISDSRPDESQADPIPDGAAL